MNEDRNGAQIFMKTTDLFILGTAFDFDHFFPYAAYFG